MARLSTSSGAGNTKADSAGTGEDDVVRAREAVLRAQYDQQPTHERTPPRAEEFQGAKEPKTGGAGEDRRAEEPKSCGSSPSSGHDAVEAVARAGIDQMVDHDKPTWRAGFWLARALQQHRLEREPDVLVRAAHAAVARADALRSDYDLDPDDLGIEMGAVWDSIKIVDSNVVLAVAQQARERPGTFRVTVPERIQLLVDVLWRLGQLGGRGVAHPSQKGLAKALGCEPRMVSGYLRVAAQDPLRLITCVDPQYIPGRKGMTWKVSLEHYTPPGAEER